MNKSHIKNSVDGGKKNAQKTKKVCFQPLPKKCQQFKMYSFNVGVRK